MTLTNNKLAKLRNTAHVLGKETLNNKYDTGKIVKIALNKYIIILFHLFLRIFHNKMIEFI